MLYEGAHHRSCPFRTQGHRGAALVAEGVHLFFDDVGGLANRATEEVGFFDDRNADLTVTEGAENLAGLLFEMLPGFNVAGQNVVHALDACNTHFI